MVTAIKKSQKETLWLFQDDKGKESFWKKY
jgi:hypothetical protein